MSRYIGRFAPSPTGPLHFGSLIAAVASYCDAKSNNGQWLVRMEDLDKPREVQGAADCILKTLTAYGFIFDGEIVYQSNRSILYERALSQLQSLNKVYVCVCSRREIADSAAEIGIEGVIYPKTCIKTPPTTKEHIAWRILTTTEIIAFSDSIQGKVSQNLARDIGDFVVKRADGLFAYQLAVVVDDADQNITHIVRGADLLNSTARQIYLQKCLDYPYIQYAHIPVATNATGEKLSKQTLAKSISVDNASEMLWLALDFLCQFPPKELKHKSLSKIWDWAISNWRLANIHGASKTTSDQTLI